MEEEEEEMEEEEEEEMEEKEKFPGSSMGKSTLSSHRHRGDRRIATVGTR